MIDFSPNPTGPAHLGTLRSYAVAWTAAQERDERLCLRFDAPRGLWMGPGDRRHPYEPWAEQFCGELAALKMGPDEVIYSDERIYVDHLDSEGLRVLPFPRKSVWADQMAIYDVPKDPFASSMAADWKTGMKEVPMAPLPEVGRAFVAFKKDGDRWFLDVTLVNMIFANIRGSRTVVRSHLSSYLGLVEEMNRKKFGFPKYEEQIITAVVVGETSALSKHALAVDEEGTVGWAIKRLGAGELQERILKSVEKDDRPIIPYWDII